MATTTESALRSALGLCDYLARHWPEVGLLPATQGTKQDVEAALATDAGPQSCYPVDVETLRGMLDEQLEKASTLAGCNGTSGILYSRKMTARRIEALTMAIEALGGAL